VILSGQAYSFAYKFSTKPAADARALPVSVTYPTDNPWVTIPWDQAVDDPEGQVPGTGGWTFLYGPCVAVITGEVGLMSAQREAQSHIRLYETASSDGGIVAEHNAWEWMVGSKEGNTVHLDGSWVVNLAAGRRLRMSVDYWHATAPAKIFRANVQGVYWRP
jgi:hypothetical protein